MLAGASACRVLSPFCGVRAVCRPARPVCTRPMPTSTLGRRRARPVADAPVLDGAQVAKAWLVELVALAPLERAARLPGPRFAEDAPRLCAAVAAALASDAALDDLEPGGALAPLAAGAGHLAAAPAPL